MDVLKSSCTEFILGLRCDYIYIARKHLENAHALLNVLSEPNIIAFKQRVGRYIYLYRFVSHSEVFKNVFICYFIVSFTSHSLKFHPIFLTYGWRLLASVRANCTWSKRIQIRITSIWPHGKGSMKYSNSFRCKVTYEQDPLWLILTSLKHCERKIKMGKAN